MAEKTRPFRVFTRKGIILVFSQAALGKWLFDVNVDPEQLADPLAYPGLRVEVPGGATASVLFLQECILAYRNQAGRRALLDSYCPIRGYRSYRWRNVSRRLRHMKTAQEKRLHGLVLVEEGEPAVRAARRPRVLPDRFDDFWRHNEKNWKRFRRAQWRSREAPLD